MTIWMEVDLKNKELPTGRMSNTSRGLARLCGINPTGVANAMSRSRRTGQRCRYVKVEIEEDDNE